MNTCRIPTNRRARAWPLALLLSLSTLCFPATPEAVPLAIDRGDRAAPRVQAGRSEKICQVVGEHDRQTGEPTVNRTESRYRFWGTDLGASFEHKGKLFFLFGDTHASAGLIRPHDADLIATSDDENPEDCLRLSFPAEPDGGYRPLTIPGVKLGPFGVPTGGFSANGKIHVFATTGFSRTNPMGRSVLAISGDDGRTFKRLYDFSTSKFINVAPAVVDANSIPGLPVASEEAVLYWASGRYRASNPYLAVTSTDQVEDRESVRYFAGIDSTSGNPRWSKDEADSQPLFQQACLGELSVAWNPYLGRWLMLYNCGTPQNKIYLRSAEKPWGPWSEPEVLFDPERDDGYCRFMNPGPRVVTANAQSDGCGAVSDPHNPLQPGDAYGPYLIPRFTRGSADGTSSEIYFLMSTWNPYTVVLMRSEVSVTGATVAGPVS